MNVAFPFRFDARGRTAESADEAYVRELIEVVLFTAPGERVMRPDFGCGVAQLVFGPNSPEIAGATQMLVQGALTQWLGELIAVQDVRVRADDSTLRIQVEYTLRGDDTVRLADLERRAP
jgi:phage baseplate assembly protein W